MGLELELLGPLLVGELQHHLGEANALLVGALNQIEGPQTPQHPEALGGLAQLVAQRVGPRVSPLDLFGRVALDRAERRAELGEHLQLQPHPVGALGHREQQLQAPLQVADGLLVGRGGLGPLAGFEPLTRRRLEVYAPRRLEVLGQQLGLDLGEVTKPLLEGLGDPPVVHLTRALEQRLVGGILDEGRCLKM